MPLKRLALFSYLFAFALSTFAQQPSIASSPPQPVRDTQAVAVLQSAIAAMGGSAAVVAVLDVTVQGTLENATGARGQAVGFVWKAAGSEFRQEFQTDGTTTRIYVSGHGSPRDLRGSAWVSVPYHESRAVLPYQVPALVLLNELGNSNYTVSYVGAATINGRPAIQIHTCDESDFISHIVLAQDWFFDAQTAVPLQVNFKLPSDTAANDPRDGSIQFSNFQISNGISVPMQLALQEGNGSATAIVSSVQFNSGVPASEFDPPTGSDQ
jgi:hypothetical protein